MKKKAEYCLLELIISLYKSRLLTKDKIMKLEKSVTILYSADVRKSLEYFTEKLGFENKWEWDDPPTFGGVYWFDVEVFFCKQGQGNPGTWLSIMVDNVDEYYNHIKDKGAKIISVPDSKPWNMREMLIEAPDGHIIRFGNRIDCD